MKKFVSRFVLLLVLCSVFVSLPEINMIKASGTIYIRADGSVDPVGAPIQRDGNVYTFTDNIYDSIIAERDNIVVDGAGYALQAQAAVDAVGVDLRDRNNVTVRNLRIKSFLGRCGILLLNSNNCNIYRNNLTNNNIGIEMVDRSSRNRIIENHLENNHMGLELFSVNPGSDNTISANEISNNTNGMIVKDFINTNILGNKLVMNEYALVVGAGSGSILRNNTMTDNTYGFKAFNVQGVEVDTSNTVNGKPIYYWVNQRGKTVPADAGYVALIGCTGITVKNLYLAGNLEGVFLGSTTNSTIVNNRLSGNLFGINLDSSHNNTISGNIVTNNQNGIGLTSSSSNNTIYGNEITANTSGLFIDDASGNSIIGNNITNSETGVYTQYCGINTIHHNNFINNTKNWDDEGLAPFPWGPPVSVSVWDDGKEGNYWDDYTGADSDGDGIGDTPYVIGENNQDNHPLMNPVVIPEFLDDENPKIPTPEPFPITWIAGAIAIIAAVGAALLVYFVKVKKTTGKTEKLHEGVM